MILDESLNPFEQDSDYYITTTQIVETMLSLNCWLNNHRWEEAVVGIRQHTKGRRVTIHQPRWWRTELEYFYPASNNSLHFSYNVFNTRLNKCIIIHVKALYTSHGPQVALYKVWPAFKVKSLSCKKGFKKKFPIQDMTSSTLVCVHLKALFVDFKIPSLGFTFSWFHYLVLPSHPFSSFRFFCLRFLHFSSVNHFTSLLPNKCGWELLRGSRNWWKVE